jgi:pyruvate kinase
MAQLTNAQKAMVHKCNLVGKPVIVATQMLESMQKNPRPTRAEVSDVTNAVHDGADAVMLSGESANGLYPVESVKMMNSIIDEAERWIEGRPPKLEVFPAPGDHLESVCYSAVKAAGALKADCIIVLTRKGNSARTLAKFRPNCPIMAFTPDAKVARQLILTRGIHPMVNPALVRTTAELERQQPLDDNEQRMNNTAIIAMAVAQAKRLCLCAAGSSVVVVSSEPTTAVAEQVLAFRAIKVKSFASSSSFSAP